MNEPSEFFRLPKQGERKLLSLLLFLAFSTLLACGAAELQSKWRGREVTIDGRNAEWEDATTAVEDTSLLVGLLNDEDHLYLLLTTASRETGAKIIRQGLTVWFDKKGGKEKSFGVRFPLGIARMGIPFAPRDAKADPESDGVEERLKASLSELEILGPGKNERQRMMLSEAKGIQLGMSDRTGKLVYELKVPLAEAPERPYAIGTRPGEIIGIGVETYEIDRKNFGKTARPIRIGGRPAEPPGGRTGPRGGFGERPGTKGKLEPIKLWAKIRLAKESPPESSTTQLRMEGSQ